VQSILLREHEQQRRLPHQQFADGSFKVQFSGGGVGYTSEWYNDTQDMNLAAVVGVNVGATTTGINAVLAQAGSISGRVTNGATGIQNVYVYVCKYNGPTRNDCDYGFGGANTDANGDYVLSGLPWVNTRLSSRQQHRLRQRVVQRFPEPERIRACFRRCGRHDDRH